LVAPDLRARFVHQVADLLDGHADVLVEVDGIDDVVAVVSSNIPSRFTRSSISAGDTTSRVANQKFAGGF